MRQWVNLLTTDVPWDCCCLCWSPWLPLEFTMIGGPLFTFWLGRIMVDWVGCTLALLLLCCWLFTLLLFLSRLLLLDWLARNTRLSEFWFPSKVTLTAPLQWWTTHTNSSVTTIYGAKFEIQSLHLLYLLSISTVAIPHIFYILLKNNKTFVRP